MLTMFCWNGQVYREKRGLTHANPHKATAGGETQQGYCKWGILDEFVGIK
jgi:hypothetical protein